MGMSNQGPENDGPIAEINITPFVDVMLVLLVIFMVTAPMLFNGMNMELPKTKKVNSLNLSGEQIILSIDRSGEYFLGKQKILKTELVPELKARIKESRDKTIFLQADFSLAYGKVAYLMSILKKNGLGKLALVTEVERAE
jgi:biopolymer transport protein ExbD